MGVTGTENNRRGTASCRTKHRSSPSFSAGFLIRHRSQVLESEPFRRSKLASELSACRTREWSVVNRAENLAGGWLPSSLVHRPTNGASTCSSQSYPQSRTYTLLDSCLCDHIARHNRPAHSISPLGPFTSYYICTTMADPSADATAGAPPDEAHTGNPATMSEKQNGDVPRPPVPDKTITDADPEKPKPGQPAGGFDSTPVPRAPPGYTVKFTFHRATNLPMADINSVSSDPFILATLYTGLPKRHKEDPDLTVRTNTIRRNVNPEWNFEWIVANVPASGFKLKARIYDEDPADHDDRLGNATIISERIDEHWPGIGYQSYKIKKRMGSKRAYLIRMFAVCTRQTKHLNGSLTVSAELLGRTQDTNGGRAYTLGPNWWTKHYSPLLGRLTGSKDPKENGEQETNGQQKKRQVQNYKSVGMHPLVQFRANLTSVSKPINFSFKVLFLSSCTTDTSSSNLSSKACSPNPASLDTS